MICHPFHCPGSNKLRHSKYWALLCHNFFHLNSTLIKLSTRLLSPCTLSEFSLCDVTRSTLVAKLIYASPAWWGYISNASKMRLQKIIQKLQTSGFLPLHFETVSALCDSADDALFHSILYNENPCPVPGYLLLPSMKHTGHDFRPRAHNKILSRADFAMRKNFIIRMLYK